MDGILGVGAKILVGRVTGRALRGMVFAALLGVWAALPPVLLAGEAAPIQIVADRMESHQKEEAVVFVGNVEASQEGVVIRADEMTVYYARPAADAANVEVDSQKISKLRARGNVRVNQENWIATGDALEYFSEERRVLLTGNTTVLQNDNKISGDRIILYLDEGRSVVERDDEGGERVKGVFFPGAAK
jgi:lipopolysaccharide export system protein LptA